MSEKIFTVHERAEAAEPSDRVLLVREGFSYAALVFGVLWLLAHRLWLEAGVYLALLAGLVELTQLLPLPPLGALVLEVLLSLSLAVHAYDLKRWHLARRGYREAGVLVAESAVAAEQRYYEHAA